MSVVIFWRQPKAIAAFFAHRFPREFLRGIGTGRLELGCAIARLRRVGIEDKYTIYHGLTEMRVFTSIGEDERCVDGRNGRVGKK